MPSPPLPRTTATPDAPLAGDARRAAGGPHRQSGLRARHPAHRRQRQQPATRGSGQHRAARARHPGGHRR